MYFTSAEIYGDWDLGPEDPFEYKFIFKYFWTNNKKKVYAWKLRKDFEEQNPDLEIWDVGECHREFPVGNKQTQIIGDDPYIVADGYAVQTGLCCIYLEKIKE